MAAGEGIRMTTGQTHHMGMNRSQDDAMVGYVFQRPTEPDLNAQSSTFQTKALRAWTLTDDSIIDNVRENTFL